MADSLERRRPNQFYSDALDRIISTVRETAGKPRSIETLKPGEVQVRRMRLGDSKEVQAYVDFLNAPENQLHFADLPETVDTIREMAKSKSAHFLVATRVEEENGNLIRKMVGGALLSDEKVTNDHWINLVVVDPRKKGEGIGHEILRGVIDWSFDHPTFNGRFREQLHIGINVGIDGWKVMEKVARECGFKWFQAIGKEVPYWNVSEPGKEPYMIRDKVFKDKKIKPEYVKKYKSVATRVEEESGKIVRDEEEIAVFKLINVIQKDDEGHDIEATKYEEVKEEIDLSKHVVREERDYKPDEIHMPDGTVYTVVKIPTKRYLFRYVVDIKSEGPERHKSWDFDPENWTKAIDTTDWSHNIGATEFPKIKIS